MARTVRDAPLGSRESRLKLKPGRRYFRGIHDGLALAYRRGYLGSGTWSVRLLQSNDKYALRRLGVADDNADANGSDILNFSQAQKLAIEFDEQVKRDAGLIRTHATVAEATERYLKWFRIHRKSITETEHTINAHILPTLGERKINALKAYELQAWLEDLAAQPARSRTPRYEKEQKFRDFPKTTDEKRARRASANRIFSILRAILNKAFADGLVSDNVEWRKVKSFAKVDETRIRFLTDAEAMRLVNACASDLKDLIKAALLTGCRYGELVAMKVHDVDMPGANVYIAESKSGKPRHVPLNEEGITLFRNLIKGKSAEKLLFTRADDKVWGKNHHVRPLKEACAIAKINPVISFHELRHTYASHLVQAGVDLLTISRLLGHADTRITCRHYAHLVDKTLEDAVTKLQIFTSEKRNEILVAVK